MWRFTSERAAVGTTQASSSDTTSVARPRAFVAVIETASCLGGGRPTASHPCPVPSQAPPPGTGRGSSPLGAARNDIEQGESGIDRPVFPRTGEVPGMGRTPHLRAGTPYGSGLVSVPSVEVRLHVGDRPAPGPVAQGLLEGGRHYREWLTGPGAILIGKPSQLLEELCGDRHQPHALSERGDSRFPNPRSLAPEQVETSNDGVELVRHSRRVATPAATRRFETTAGRWFSGTTQSATEFPGLGGREPLWRMYRRLLCHPDRGRSEGELPGRRPGVGRVDVCP